MTHNRPAFLLTGALMVVIMLISLGAFLLLLHGFVDEIAPTIPDVMTDIPTLYYYDEEGEKITNIDGSIRSEAEAKLQQLYVELEELYRQLAVAEETAKHSQIPRIKLDIHNLKIDIADLEASLAALNVRLEFYWMFAYPSLAILFIFIMFASAAYYWEKGFAIFQRGTSMKIIKTSIIGMVAIILLPEFWDIYAIEMKKFSMYLIDPLVRIQKC